MSTVTQNLAQNDLLEALAPADLDLIRPYLNHEMRPSGDVLYHPGDDIGRVFFPLGASQVSYAVNNISGGLCRRYWWAARERSAELSAVAGYRPIA